MMAQKHIHFIGICGVAMSALAIAFKQKGWRVTGSDVGFYPPVSTNLKKAGIDYYPGWHPEKMTANKDPDLVVVGNVASSTNPEWLYVQDKKLNYKSYPEVIKEFFVKQKSIVCAGTYGKSTSTTLLSWIFTESGLDPSYMFGGSSLNHLPSAAMTDSEWSILEGDEYKSSRWDIGPKFAYYSPTHLLLTAIVWDHADIYPTETEYINVFKKLFDVIPQDGLKIISEQAATVLEAADQKGYASKGQRGLVTYGKSTTSDYYYSHITQTKSGISFSITHNISNTTFPITSSCIGEYMANNITGCFAMAHQIGIDHQKIISAIKSFQGMKRRLEKRYDDDIMVFDDIAHSPTKATAVLETLKKIYEKKSRLIVIFEPNTGNRRPQSAPWYNMAFAAADEVIVPQLTKLKIDPKNLEQPFEGQKLANIIAATHPLVSYHNEDDELVDYLKQNSKTGDVIVFLGSHGFRGMIDQLITKLRSK